MPEPSQEQHTVRLTMNNWRAGDLVRILASDKPTNKAACDSICIDVRRKFEKQGIEVPQRLEFADLAFREVPSRSKPALGI